MPGLFRVTHIGAEALGSIKERLPAIQQFKSTWAVIIFLVFSWGIYRFLYQLPSWIKYLSLSDCIGILSYALAFALLESCFVMVVLVIFTFLMPMMVSRDKFVAQSSAMLFWISLCALIIHKHFKIFEPLPLKWLIGFCLVISMVIVSVLVKRLKALENILLIFADRAVIFLYIYVPLGLLGMIIVILRNIYPEY